MYVRYTAAPRRPASCARVRARERVRPCGWLAIHMYSRIYVRVRVYMYVCMYVYTYVCVCVCVCVCV